MNSDTSASCRRRLVTSASSATISAKSSSVVSTGTDRQFRCGCSISQRRMTSSADHAFATAARFFRIRWTWLSINENPHAAMEVASSSTSNRAITSSFRRSACSPEPSSDAVGTPLATSAGTRSLRLRETFDVTWTVWGCSGSRQSLRICRMRSFRVREREKERDELQDGPEDHTGARTQDPMIA